MQLTDKWWTSRPEDFPIASRNQDEVLSLPMYAELTDDMAARVASEIRSFFGRGGQRRGRGSWPTTPRTD